MMSRALLLVPFLLNLFGSVPGLAADTTPDLRAAVIAAKQAYESANADWLATEATLSAAERLEYLSFVEMLKSQYQTCCSDLEAAAPGQGEPLGCLSVGVSGLGGQPGRPGENRDSAKRPSPAQSWNAPQPPSASSASPNGQPALVVPPATVADQPVSPFPASRPSELDLDAEFAASVAEFDELLLGEQGRLEEREGRVREGRAGGGADEAQRDEQGGARAEGAPPKRAGGPARWDDVEFDGGKQREGYADPGTPGDGATREKPPQVRTPDDVGDGSDDDVIARQLREAAQREPDPELRERLWDEYRKYKKSL